ncbi:E3 ubiquitin ligase [Dispira simplex]|nr:E3 ubiquitin ligase [Dispira simplex]
MAIGAVFSPVISLNGSGLDSVANPVDFTHEPEPILTNMGRPNLSDLRKACHELRQQYKLLYKLHDYVRQMNTYQGQLQKAQARLAEGKLKKLYTKPCALECGHMFCQTCLVSWFRIKKKCPTCRKAVERRPVVMFDVQTQVDALKKLEEVRPCELDPTVAVSLNSLFTQIKDQPELMRNLFNTHTSDTEDPSGKKELTNVLTVIKSLSGNENTNTVNASTTSLENTCSSAVNKGKAPAKDPWEGLFSESLSAPRTAASGSGMCIICGAPPQFCRECLDTGNGTILPSVYRELRTSPYPPAPLPTQSTLPPVAPPEHLHGRRLNNAHYRYSRFPIDLQTLLEYGLYDNPDDLEDEEEDYADEDYDMDERYSYDDSDTDNIPYYFDDSANDELNDALGVSTVYHDDTWYEGHSDNHPTDTIRSRQPVIRAPRASNPIPTTAPATTTPNRVRSAATSRSTQTASIRQNSTNRPTIVAPSGSSRTRRSTQAMGQVISDEARTFMFSGTPSISTRATPASYSMARPPASNPVIGSYWVGNTTTTRPRESSRRSSRRSRQRAATGGNH